METKEKFVNISLIKNAIYNEKSYLEKIQKIVGENHFEINEFNINKYSKTTIPNSRRCKCIAYPGSREEIKAIIKIANQYDCEVWPFSRGNNWGYGSTTALNKDVIILILERLNNIIEVNEELAYAVIEPGVSQIQLNEYLKERNINLWTDCTDSTPYGSVLGNAIERGFGYTPYGDHYQQICGMEILLPSGDIIRTGGPHGYSSDSSSQINKWSKTWNTFRQGCGPDIMGLFSQSNFGIVLKIGLWLMPKPEKFAFFSFELEDESKLDLTIETLRKLAQQGIIKSKTHMVNSFQMLSVVGKYPYELLEEGKTCLTVDQIDEIRKSYKIPKWVLAGGVYGIQEKVNIDIKIIKKSLSKLGKVEFFDQNKFSLANKFLNHYKNPTNSILKNILLETIKPILSKKPIEFMRLLPGMFNIMQGNPNNVIIKSAYFKSNKIPLKDKINPAHDECGVMWFAPVISSKGEEFESYLKLVKPLYQKHGFEFSACITMINERCFYMLLGIFFQKKEKQECDRANKLFQELKEISTNNGYHQYRAGLDAMKDLLDVAPNLHGFLSDLKKTIDPNNILAPGRYGI